MKILETGIRPDAWTKEVRCHGCLSKLEVCISDLYRSVKTDYRGESYDDHKVALCDCPVCHAKVNVDISNGMTGHLYNKIRTIKDNSRSYLER